MKTEITQQEVADELERERRVLQLQMCEYLIKVNEIKAKKGAELLQHLIDYYHAQTNYLEDSLETMQHFGHCMQDLVDKVSAIKTRHDEQKRLLVNTREELKKLVEKETGQPTGGYSLHQAIGNKAHGTKKTGFLWKKSDGKVKRVWQRRRARVSEGGLLLYHADESKAPVRLELLTCQVKLPQDEGANSKRCFDLVSNNRTYKFQAEDEKDVDEWISVLNNAKQEVFERAMMSDEPSDVGGGDAAATSTSALGGMWSDLSTSMGGGMMSASTYSTGALGGKALRQAVVEEIKRLPGNDRCCDCAARDPEWCSVNLGVLICLECCGVHRELGVHLSRTQSLTMDDLSTNQLLLPRFIGNTLFNEVYESTLADGCKPKPSSAESDLEGHMRQLKNFIRAKYVERRYVYATTSGEDEQHFLRRDLLHAVRDCNLTYLLQVCGENLDLMTPFSLDDDEEAGRLKNTAIHVALEAGSHWPNDNSSDPEPPTNLHVIEFILQNTSSAHLQRVNLEGETILHYCARFNCPDAMKLILKAIGLAPNSINDVKCVPIISATNKAGQTSLEVAEACGACECADLLRLVATATSSQSQPGDRRDRSTMEVLDQLCVNWQLSEDLNHVQPSPSNNHAAKTKEVSRDPSLASCDGVSSGATTSVNAYGFTVEGAENEVKNDCNSSAHAAPQAPVNTRPAHSKPQRSHSSACSSTGKSAFDAFTEKHKWFSDAKPSPGLNVGTLPRKRSTKGPAPRPPILTNQSRSDSLGGQPIMEELSSYLSKKRHSTPSAKPSVPPKPRLGGTSASVTPTHTTKPTNSTSKVDSTKTVDTGGRGRSFDAEDFTYPTATSANFSSSSRQFQTLPKRIGLMQSSFHGERDLFSSPLSIAHRREEARTRPVSQCSDHIDVLLDVLEEPPKDRPKAKTNLILGIEEESDSQEDLTKIEQTSASLDSGHASPPTINQSETATPSAPAKDSQPASGGRKMRALYNCEAEHVDELTFKKGDFIMVTKTDDEDWWEGYTESEPDRKGLLPATYVQPVGD